MNNAKLSFMREIAITEKDCDSIACYRHPDVNSLLFGSLDLPMIDQQAVARHLLNIELSHWYWDPYRETSMLPLMTIDGNSTRPSASQRRAEVADANSDFKWTKFAPTALKDYFAAYIFPWVKPRPRIMALLTMPGARNREHIDCERAGLGQNQHKLRMVVQGRSDTLYFITKQGRIYAPHVERPFLMDGSWPHGMENTDTLPKLTICLGTPWQGSGLYPKFASLLLNRGLVPPDSLETFFEQCN